MMNAGGWDGMGGWGWFGMALMLLFWFGLIALLLVAVGNGRPWRSSTTPSGLPSADPAQTLLRARFARGEITADEYEQARSVLRDGN